MVAAASVVTAMVVVGATVVVAGAPAVMGPEGAGVTWCQAMLQRILCCALACLLL